MINKKYLKLLRSEHRYDENNFIYKIIAKRIIDSIDLITVDFKNILEIGINENTIYNYLKKRYLKTNIYRSDLCISKNENKNIINFLELNIDEFNLKKDHYNLIFSNCFLHLTDNFEDKIKMIFNSMKSNSFFIAAIPDKENMYQLLNSMYETDIFFYDGVFQRFNPTIEIDNILTYFKRYQFDNPLIHSENIIIHYSLFSKLLKDIKMMNLSYAYNDKKKIFEKKKYFEKLENIYLRDYYDNGFKIDIKINFISGWKK